MKSLLMFWNLLAFILCIASAALWDKTTVDIIISLILAGLNAFIFELNRRTD